MEKLTFLSCLMAAGFAGPQSAATAVVDGVNAYQQGEYQQAMEEWLPYAAMGDANALFNLGQMYRLGKGVPVDFEMAEYYYRRAAEKNHRGAQGNLGTLYYFGKGPVNKDVQQAFNWWEKAARAGDARSQYMLGILYYNGEGVPLETTTAYGWIWQAAQQGLPEAVAAEEKLADYLAEEDKVQARVVVGKLVDYQSNTVQKTELTANAGAEGDQDAPALKQTSAVKAVKAPAANETPASAESAAKDGAYLVQLASYRSEEMAQMQWAKMAKQMPELMAGLSPVIERADLGEKGVYYRLQAGPFATKADAKGRCDSLKAAGRGCLIVKAK